MLGEYDQSAALLPIQFKHLCAGRIRVDAGLAHIGVHQRLLPEVIAALALRHNQLFTLLVLLLDGHRATAYDEELVAHFALANYAAAGLEEFLQLILIVIAEQSIHVYTV